MEALLDLREGLGTHLADKRERSKRKDRPICDEIRVPSEVLWQGNGRHIREMATAASWHPRRRKRTAAITSTAPSLLQTAPRCDDRPSGFVSFPHRMHVAFSTLHRYACAREVLSK